MNIEFRQGAFTTSGDLHDVKGKLAIIVDVEVVNGELNVTFDTKYEIKTYQRDGITNLTAQVVP